MSLRTINLTAAVTALGLTGCGKKTEAELAEEERVKLRAQKREEAAKAYGTLAEKFPDHPKAKEAAAKAAALKAAPKK